MIKASIDILSSVACIQHLVHLKSFCSFFSGHPPLSACASSCSSCLLHPCLSLCFPTVIDSSLQSLTVAHQHLLRSGETERVVGKCLLCVANLLMNRIGLSGRKVRHYNFYFLIHIYCCRDLVCCCFMVCGLREHLIMQLTWVLWFVAMVIAKRARVL